MAGCQALQFMTERQCQNLTMAEDVSVPDLISQLCKIHLGPVQRVHHIQPAVTRQDVLKKMKKKAFDTLFSHQRNVSRDSNPDNWYIYEAEPFYQKVEWLRAHSNQKDADRLLHLFDTLFDSKYRDCLKFLAALRDCGGTKFPAHQSGGMFGQLLSKTDGVFDYVLSQLRRKHSSTKYKNCLDDSGSFCVFPHYPDECFQTESPIATGEELSLMSYFNFGPGEGLGGGDFYSQKLLLQDDYEKKCHSSLFGGLVQGKLESLSCLSTALDFTDTNEPPCIRTPVFEPRKSLSCSQLSEESGLCSAPPSMSSSVSTLSGTCSPSSSFTTLPPNGLIDFVTVEQALSDPWFWIKVVDAPRSKHFTWETIGLPPAPIDRPYLTEGGPQAFDLLLKHRHSVLEMITLTWGPHLQPNVTLTCVETHILVKDILLMLAGIPSSSFLLDTVSMSFTVQPGLHISGLSPWALTDFLSDLTTCGSHVARLQRFSQPPALHSSLYKGGLVFHAFTVGVRKALSHYSAALLDIPHTVGLLQLKSHLHAAVDQISYLATLCWCHHGEKTEHHKQASRDLDDETSDGSQETRKSFDNETSEGSQETKRSSGECEFPTGLHLVSYLYQEAAVSSQHSPLLLSLLQTTCAPFGLFLRAWLFHGLLNDTYSEFMIKVDASVLSARDEKYWSQAYTMDDTVKVPHFLQGIVGDIVTCGKSINLLRLCHPRHFLCNVLERDIPSVAIAYSREALKASERECQIYAGRMRMLSSSLVRTRAQVLRRAEQAKAELRQTAKRVADAEIARLERQIADRRETEREKKRKEFARLKLQMLEDGERREEEKRLEREEEDRLAAKMAREEEALSVAEVELERRARDELIAYYEGLGEEAAARERRALWRVQRARLGGRRENFLYSDSHRWGREMEELSGREGMGNRPHVDINEQNRTVGMEGVGKTKRTEVVSRLSQEMVPDRVDKRDSLKGVEDETDSNLVELPNWVTRHADGNHTLEISDQEEVTLPAWAARELPSFVSEEEGGNGGGRDKEGLKSTVQLPSWVLREVEGVSSELSRDVEGESGDEKDLLTGGAASPCGLAVETVSVSTDKDKGREAGDFSTAVHSNVTNALCGVVKPQASGYIMGGTALPKPHVKTVAVGGGCASEETEPSTVKATVRQVSGRHAGTESSLEGGRGGVYRSSVKIVAGSITGQSEEGEARPHIKPSEFQSASRQSEDRSNELRPHIKTVEGSEVNTQTVEEREVAPRRGKVTGESVSSRSLPQVWEVKKASVHGHASQTTVASSPARLVPRLKKHALHHANFESDPKDFGIKPRIRMNKMMSATKESDMGGGDGATKPRPHLRMVKGSSANTESVRVDENQVARQRFLTRNWKGHASDSTVQRLLYGDIGNSQSSIHSSEDIVDGALPRIELEPGQMFSSGSFQSNFKELDQGICVDLMSAIERVDLGRDLVDASAASESDIEGYQFTPLSVLLARSVTAPIKAQISLVNSAVVDYFTSELKVDAHLLAIRRYLLMADGDFSEILANILFDKLASNPLSQEMFNLVFLNGALNKAIRSSIFSDDELTKNLTFDFKSIPKIVSPNSTTCLAGLELRYMVGWPLNVVLTSPCMSKYTRIFTFLLQMKQVVWALKDVWHRLKRDALLVKGAGSSSHFRHLQLHRQEMEHFVKAMQGYITNQVIHVSWQELQASLSQPVEGLSQLQARHNSYVDKAIHRCLLDQNASKVMKYIIDTFRVILQFRSQLVTGSWQKSPTGEIIHPHFAGLLKKHTSFRSLSFFLYKVVSKLSQNRYQPHLQELLLQLNFNHFYSDRQN